MKTLVLLCCLIGAAFAGDSTAHKQQGVNRLLYKVFEPVKSQFTQLADAAHNYHPEAHNSDFHDEGVAVQALNAEIKAHRVLEQHHYFSLFNQRHREEALMLFDVLMNANDWNTFISSAAHYRDQMNEGEFVYAFYVAVIHSKLSQDVVLPPLYEVTPHMFVNSEVIQQAYSAQMRQQSGTFKMGFTGTRRNPEQRVAYFGEDIGLNVHHVTWHMDFPFWWQDSYGYHLDRKGELFFWAHHQLTARFDAERLSNNLQIVDELHWDTPIVDGFAPHTTYKYGGGFPSRPDNVDFEDVDGVAKIRDMICIEDRIRDAIAHGYITAADGSTIDIRNDEGIDHLGDIIESSTYSPNEGYYHSLHNTAHKVLGRQGDPHGKFGMPPGVMEHFETATRDPSFFRLHKYMDNIFKEHKDSLPPYTADDLHFNGVSLDSVSVTGCLQTYFEDYSIDLRNAVDSGDENVDITAVVSRLNHGSFDINLDVTNRLDHDALTTVRMFLCPRHDFNGILFSHDEGRWHCIELDKFWKTLHPGHNRITRHSEDAASTVPDVPSFQHLADLVTDALENGNDMDTSRFTRSCGIPNRLLLPKGNEEGLEFRLVVALTDGEADAAIADIEHVEKAGTHTQCGIHGEKYPDKRAMGFPLDRPIPDPRVFLGTRNFNSIIVNIVHKDHNIAHNDH